MDETTKNRLIFGGIAAGVLFLVWKGNAASSVRTKHKTAYIPAKHKRTKVHSSSIPGWSCNSLSDCGDNPNVKYYKSLPEIEKEAVHYWRMHINRGLMYHSKSEANRLLKNLIKSDFVYTTTTGKSTSAHLTNLGISFINSLDDVNFSQLSDCGDRNKTKNYALIHFGNKKPIKKAYDTVSKAFYDYEDKGCVLVELFDEKGRLLASRKSNLSDNTDRFWLTDNLSQKRIGIAGETKKYAYYIWVYDDGKITRELNWQVVEKFPVSAVTKRLEQAFSFVKKDMLELAKIFGREQSSSEFKNKWWKLRDTFEQWSESN